MADVFISYKREERAQVERIAERLRGLGLSVWFDARLPSGESFDEEINRELHAAKCVLVCWSPGAVQSQWVRAEAAIGRDRDVLAAVTLAPTQLYPPFNLIHSVDLANWDGADLHPGWLSVIGRLGALADRPDLVERAGRYAAVSDAGDGAAKRVTIEKRSGRTAGKGRGWGFWAAIGAGVVALGVGGLAAVQYIQAQQYSTAAYDIVFAGRVIGLRSGSPVYFNGIEVGQVRSLLIDPRDSRLVVARLDVDSNVPIRTDSEATLETVGATLGINISAGSPDAGLLRFIEGQPVPRIFVAGAPSGAGPPATEDPVLRLGGRTQADGYFDLDNGVIAETGADLFFAHPALRIERRAVRIEPASSGDLPALSECRSALSQSDQPQHQGGGTLMFAAGDTACLVTDENHVAAIQVLVLSDVLTAPVEFRYVVWDAD